eukprot:3207101-Rhodomonas_salina.1
MAGTDGVWWRGRGGAGAPARPLLLPASPDPPTSARPGAASKGEGESSGHGGQQEQALEEKGRHGASA